MVKITSVGSEDEGKNVDITSLGSVDEGKGVVAIVVTGIVVLRIGKHAALPAPAAKPEPQDTEQEALPAAEKLAAPHGMQELLPNRAKGE